MDDRVMNLSEYEKKPIKEVKQFKKDCEEFDRAMLSIHGFEPHKHSGVIKILAAIIILDKKRK